MKKASLTFISALLIVLIFYFLNSGDVEESSVETLPSSVVAKINKNSKNFSIQSKGKTCEDFQFKLKDSLIEDESNMLWSNTHFRYNGEVFRVRYFYDDGPNGQYKKTILYKENSDGFPLIEKTFRGFEISKINELLEKGEIIWKERAYLVESSSTYWKKVNDKLVELKSKDSTLCLSN